MFAPHVWTYSHIINQASKKGKDKAPAAPASASEDTAHSLGIVSSLFSNLASDSPARIRLVAKFVENNYEKVDKLLEIRDGAASRLQAAEREIAAERKVGLRLQGRGRGLNGALQEMEDEGEELGDADDMWYLRRLDSGLFTLQTVDYCLAWIVMEDDGVRHNFVDLLCDPAKLPADSCTFATDA